MNTETTAEERPLRQLAHTIQTDIDSARTTAMDLELRLQSFVQERPIAAVISALGLGFVVARMFSRR